MPKVNTRVLSLSDGNTENIHDVHAWCGLGLPLGCYAFCYRSSLATHPHSISREERQKENPKAKAAEMSSCTLHLQMYYCLCPVLPGCKQWYGKLAAPGDQEAHPGAPWWHLSPNLGFENCSNEDPRELTSDGKNPNLLPTGLLNIANCWDPSKWAQHLRLHFPSVLLLLCQRTGSRKRSWDTSPRQLSTVVLESQKEGRKVLIASADITRKTDQQK